MFVPALRLLHKNDERAPVKNLGRGFSQIELLAGLGELRLGFKHDDASRGTVSDAHKLRLGGKVIFGVFVREALRRGWVARTAVTEYLQRCDQARDRNESIPPAAAWFVEKHALSSDQRSAIEEVLPAIWLERVRTQLTPVDRVGGSILIYKIP